jgi:hypothetical protein
MSALIGTDSPCWTSCVRYMRGREPLPGYDALTVKEIVGALEEADLATIRKIRAYERKFANRRDVLEEVARPTTCVWQNEPRARRPPTSRRARHPPRALPSIAENRDRL